MSTDINDSTWNSMACQRTFEKIRENQSQSMNIDEHKGKQMKFNGMSRTSQKVCDNQRKPMSIGEHR